MMRRGLAALLLLVVAACGSPDDGQEQGDATALRDAARAPLEQAEQVQQTIDDRAARIAAGANAGQEGDPSDPDAEKKEAEREP